jgi:hypothetical protein
MVKLGIDIPQDRLDAFCRHWQIEEFALFGSVIRDDFNPESDVDVLVTFAAEANWGLLDLVRMERELLLNRKIDLFTRQAVEQSHNWIRRQEVLTTARVVYGTR